MMKLVSIITFFDIRFLGGSILTPGNILSFVLLVTLILLIVFFRRQQKHYRKLIQDLARTEQLLKVFFDAQNEQIYLKDEAFRYVFVNQKTQAFFDKESQEILGKTDDELAQNVDFQQKRHASDLLALTSKTVINTIDRHSEKVFVATKFPVVLPSGENGIGAVVSDITAADRTRENLEKTTFRNQILLDVINRSFGSEFEQLDFVLNECIKFTESKIGYLYLYDEITQVFSLNSWSKDVMKECSIVNAQTLYALEKTGIWGEVVRQRKPIIVNEFAAPHALKKGYPEGHVAIKRFMSIPVVQNEKIIAVVGLGNKETDYTENDVFQLTVLMNGVWANIARREAQNKMNYERQKYLETIRSIGDAVLVINAKLEIEVLNSIGEQLTGWNEAQALGKIYSTVFNISHQDPTKPFIDPIVKCFQTRQPQKMEEDTVLHSKNGTTYAIEDTTAPIIGADGVISGVVLVFRDITEKQIQQEKIAFASFHDTLTGLYNRNFFEQYAMTKIPETDYPLAVMMTDVNGLKFTNDVFGHSAGDRLLQRAAEMVSGVLPKNAIISRYGGDEFIILVPSTTRKKAAAYAETISQKFETYEYNGLIGSISIGFEMLTTAAQRIVDVIIDAESLMYKQKVLDRDKYKRNLVTKLMNKLHADFPWEKAHSDNVSRLAIAFAEFIGLPQGDAEKARRTGYYHDIGKIGVEDKAVFNKPGKLTKDDWVQVKTHPLISYRILNASDDFVDIADLALHHHERWDGKGYPKGLREAEIPLLSRMIHLIGAYDIMSNHPPYRTTTPPTDILAELTQSAGKQFDPELVQQFMEFLQQHPQAAIPHAKPEKPSRK